MARFSNLWDEAEHPRDRLGRFRNKWKIGGKAKAIVDAILDRFSPKNFPDFQRANNYGVERGWSRYTPQQKKSITDYVKGNFKAVDAELKRGIEGPEVKDIDSAMHPLDDDLILTRSFSPERFGLQPNDAQAAEELTGKLIASKNYQNGWMGPAAPNGGIQMHILAPRGTPAVFPGGAEVMLSRNQPLRITRAERVPDGSLRLYAVAVPAGSGRATHDLPGAIRRGQLEHGDSVTPPETPGVPRSTAEGVLTDRAPEALARAAKEGPIPEREVSNPRAGEITPPTPPKRDLGDTPGGVEADGRPSWTHGGAPIELTPATGAPGGGGITAKAGNAVLIRDAPDMESLAIEADRAGLPEVAKWARVNGRFVKGSEAPAAGQRAAQRALLARQEHAATGGAPSEPNAPQVPEATAPSVPGTAPAAAPSAPSPSTAPAAPAVPDANAPAPTPTGPPAPSPSAPTPAPAPAAPAAPSPSPTASPDVAQPLPTPVENPPTPSSSPQVPVDIGQPVPADATPEVRAAHAEAVRNAGEDAAKQAEVAKAAQAAKEVGTPVAAPEAPATPAAPTPAKKAARVARVKKALAGAPPAVKEEPPSAVEEKPVKKMAKAAAKKTAAKVATPSAKDETKPTPEKAVKKAATKVAKKAAPEAKAEPVKKAAAPAKKVAAKRVTKPKPTPAEEALQNVEHDKANAEQRKVWADAIPGGEPKDLRELEKTQLDQTAEFVRTRKWTKKRAVEELRGFARGRSDTHAAYLNKVADFIETSPRAPRKAAVKKVLNTPSVDSLRGISNDEDRLKAMDGLGVTELRKIAGEAGVLGRSKLLKEPLKKAISDHLKGSKAEAPAKAVGRAAPKKAGQVVQKATGKASVPTSQVDAVRGVKATTPARKLPKGVTPEKADAAAKQAADEASLAEAKKSVAKLGAPKAPEAPTHGVAAREAELSSPDKKTVSTARLRVGEKLQVQQNPDGTWDSSRRKTGAKTLTVSKKERLSNGLYKVEGTDEDGNAISLRNVSGQNVVYRAGLPSTRAAKKAAPEVAAPSAPEAAKPEVKAVAKAVKAVSPPKKKGLPSTAGQMADFLERDGGGGTTIGDRAAARILSRENEKDQQTVLNGLSPEHRVKMERALKYNKEQDALHAKAEAARTSPLNAPKAPRKAAKKAAATPDSEKGYNAPGPTALATPEQLDEMRSEAERRGERMRQTQIAQGKAGIPGAAALAREGGNIGAPSIEPAKAAAAAKKVAPAAKKIATKAVKAEKVLPTKADFMKAASREDADKLTENLTLAELKTVAKEAGVPHGANVTKPVLRKALSNVTGARLDTDAILRSGSPSPSLSPEEAKTARLMADARGNLTEKSNRVGRLTERLQGLEEGSDEYNKVSQDLDVARDELNDADSDMRSLREKATKDLKAAAVVRAAAKKAVPAAPVKAATTPDVKPVKAAKIAAKAAPAPPAVHTPGAPENPNAARIGALEAIVKNRRHGAMVRLDAAKELEKLTGKPLGQVSKKAVPAKVAKVAKAVAPEAPSTPAPVKVAKKAAAAVEPNTPAVPGAPSEARKVLMDPDRTTTADLVDLERDLGITRTSLNRESRVDAIVKAQEDRASNAPPAKKTAAERLKGFKERDAQAKRAERLSEVESKVAKAVPAKAAPSDRKLEPGYELRVTPALHAPGKVNVKAVYPNGKETHVVQNLTPAQGQKELARLKAAGPDAIDAEYAKNSKIFIDRNQKSMEADALKERRTARRKQLQGEGVVNVRKHLAEKGLDTTGTPTQLINRLLDSESDGPAPAKAVKAAVAKATPAKAGGIQAGKLSSKPKEHNTWGAFEDTPMHYHNDGFIGQAVKDMGAEGALEVDGDRLDNVVGHIATDTVRGRVGQQEMMDRLTKLADRLPAGSKAKGLLKEAVERMETPKRTIDIPEGTPAPLVALAKKLENIPLARGERVGAGAGSSELSKVKKIMDELHAGKISNMRAEIMLRSDVINSRHESNEGKFEIDRAVQQAIDDLKALKKKKKE